MEGLLLTGLTPSIFKKILEQKDDLLSNEGVCRTAPATPDLLKIRSLGRILSFPRLSETREVAVSLSPSPRVNQQS